MGFYKCHVPNYYFYGALGLVGDMVDKDGALVSNSEFCADGPVFDLCLGQIFTLVYLIMMMYILAYIGCDTLLGEQNNFKNINVKILRSESEKAFYKIFIPVVQFWAKYQNCSQR